MPRAKQRTPELRSRVLAAAVDHLNEEGVAGFTTRSVARRAATSPPAIYELFGDRAGLVRAVFFEGWRRFGDHLAGLEQTADPRADALALVLAYRRFLREHRVLAEVMLSRPFTDFDPTEEEREAGAVVRRRIVGAVRRLSDAGVIEGDETDVAHVLIALVQGLAAAENAGRLARSQAALERRWTLALDALLAGLAP